MDNRKKASEKWVEIGRVQSSGALEHLHEVEHDFRAQVRTRQMLRQAQQVSRLEKRFAERDNSIS